MTELVGATHPSSRETTLQSRTQVSLVNENLLIASPVQGIAPINKVVSALFSYKKPATYKDIAAATGFARSATVSQALSASRDLGLTDLAGERGLYRLTAHGEEYARFLQTGKEEDAKRLLQTIIKAGPMWAEVTAFLRATRGEPRDPIDFVIDVERKLGKKWSQDMRRLVRDSYVSILAFAGLVKKEGNKVISTFEELPAQELIRSEMQRPANEFHQGLGVSDASVTSNDFVQLRSDDFVFQVRKDPVAIEFAKSQFEAWVEHLRKSYSLSVSSSSTPKQTR